MFCHFYHLFYLTENIILHKLINVFFHFYDNFIKKDHLLIDDEFRK